MKLDDILIISFSFLFLRDLGISVYLCTQLNEYFSKRINTGAGS